MINYRIRKRNTPIATLFKNYADKKSGKVSESRREIQRRFDCLDWKDQKKIILAFLDSCPRALIPSSLKTAPSRTSSTPFDLELDGTPF